MTFLDQATLALSGEWIQRVEMAMLKVAGAVQAESASTPDHALRTAWATAVSNRPLEHREALAKVIAARDDSLKSEADDATLEAAVVASWNLMAGVETK